MPNPIQDEILKMNNDLGYMNYKTEPPSTNPPESSDLKTDPPTTELPPENDDLKTSPPETSSPEDESEDKDKTIEMLRKVIEESGTKDKPKVPKTEPPTTKEPSTPTTDPPIDFIGDIDPVDLSGNKEELNKILNSVFSAAKKSNPAIDTKTIISSFPQLIDRYLEMKKSSDEFYVKNPDLSNYKKTVSSVYTTLVENNPNETHEKIMELLAEESRRRLSLPAIKKQKQQQTQDHPRLPKKKSKPGSSSPDDKPKNPIISQIDEMNKTLRR